MDMHSKELRAVGETSAFISSAVRTKDSDSGYW
jgi:AhpD family alkylhydroperoxidase